MKRRIVPILVVLLVALLAHSIYTAARISSLEYELRVLRGEEPVESATTTPQQNGSDVPAASLKFKIILPSAGQKFCTGDLIPIQWQNPAEAKLQSVVLTLTTPTSANRIGSVSAQSGNDTSKGYLLWDGKLESGALAKIGGAYKIHIASRVGNRTIEAQSDSTFVIEDCTQEE